MIGSSCTGIIETIQMATSVMIIYSSATGRECNVLCLKPESGYMEGRWKDDVCEREREREREREKKRESREQEKDDQTQVYSVLKIIL